MTGSRRLFLTGTAALLAGCSARGRPVASPGTTPARPSIASTGSRPSPAPTTAAPPPTADLPDLLHGPAAAGALALTFHGAGSAALTRRVLAEAASAGAKLTVLAVGTWLRDSPELATAVLDGGHELGNHTWSHRTMPRLGAAAADAEVARAAQELRRLTGTPGRWFRPSGTPRSTAVIRQAARRAGYDRCLAYDLDPLDYTDPPATTIAQRVLAGARPGSIVSLHLGHADTAAALPEIFDGLSRRQLTAVTAGQLLGPARS